MRSLNTTLPTSCCRTITHSTWVALPRNISSVAAIASRPTIGCIGMFSYEIDGDAIAAAAAMSLRSMASMKAATISDGDIDPTLDARPRRAAPKKASSTCSTLRRTHVRTQGN